MKNGIVLGFDFGEKRVGVATGNTITRQANALCTINRISKKSRKYNAEKFFAEISELLTQWKPIILIVGLPTHLDGSESKMTKYAKIFAQQLTQKFNISVEFSDERLTSTIAESLLKDEGFCYSKNGDNLKHMIDAVSAQIILQTWLDNLDNFDNL